MFCCILVSNTQSDNYRLYPYELFQDHIHFSLQPIKRERVHINIIDIMNVVFMLPVYSNLAYVPAVSTPVV